MGRRGCNAGKVWVQSWKGVGAMLGGVGATLERCRCDVGKVWVRHWKGVGATLERCGCDVGKLWVRCWEGEGATWVGFSGRIFSGMFVRPSGMACIMHGPGKRKLSLLTNGDE